MPPAAEELRASGLPAHLAILLAQRGVASAPEAERFLSPSLAHLHDGDGLRGLAAAVEAFLAARAAGLPVVVVGDYDVDGVTSTALLLAACAACGIRASPVLPHRMRDGYGLQPSHAVEAAALGAGLLVAVDCGTTSHQAVAEAARLGLPVVVIDHHLPGKELPPGAIVVNPRQAACTYPFEHLSAAGLAFKVALALAGRCGKPVPVDALLRIACLGTVADMVPMVGENRTIAALGLAALAHTRSRGLLELFRRARLRAPFAADDVGFRIGPRLNAAGRLESAELALELLMTRDRRRAEELAERLETLNQRRRQLEGEVVAEARERVAARPHPPPLVVEWSPGWHRGVVGIAAGRLARELHRPVLLLTEEGGIATGSGRSVSGLHLHAFLSRWAARMERFGGHAQAVGMTVRVEELPGLAAEWAAAAAAWPAATPPELRYDLRLTPAAAAEPPLLADLERLEPHGEGNPRPLLRIGPFDRGDGIGELGRGHLAGRLCHGAGGRLPFVGWGWGERGDELASRVEVLAHLERDRWSAGARLRLVDCRATDEPS